MTAGQVQGQPGWIGEALREHEQHEQAEHEQLDAARDAAGTGASCRWPTGSSRSWTGSTGPGAAAPGSGKNASRCRTERAARRRRP